MDQLNFSSKLVLGLLLIVIFITIFTTQFYLPIGFEILLITMIVFSNKVRSFVKETVF